MSRSCCREVERRILRHLHDCKTRTQLPQIHSQFLRHNLLHSSQILSHFLAVCASLRQMKYANSVFLQFQNPSILLFNPMIKGYSLCPPFEKSIQLFCTMKTRGIWPNEFTFAPLLKSCSNVCDLKIGQAVHGEVVLLGFGSFSAIRIGIVELYASCGRMGDAKKVFDEMIHRDVLIWNLMIRGFCKVGNVDMGYHVFRQMRDRTRVSWNTMISCLAQSGRYGDALDLFREMLEDGGFNPDDATVVTMLPVCARLGEDGLGNWIHSHVKSSLLFQDFISVGNSLVDFYCKRGDLDTAFMVFEEMPQKNVVSWNSMISGLAFNGKGERGLALFDEMIHNGFCPNDSTFMGVLACCVHAGLVQRGRVLFDQMVSNHHLKPKQEHYGCMVDLLGRNGFVDEAHKLIGSMTIKPNAALWGALLSACRIHGNTELAECATKELIVLEPWNSGNYVLLSNIYAERGKWDEVEKVRLEMVESKIKKAPGQSMVG